jgi:hypothetical protein
MKLGEWLREMKITCSEFARQINVSQVHIHKYLYEGAIPKNNIMKRIYVATLGSVTANDFNDLDDELLKKSLEKKR